MFCITTLLTDLSLILGGGGGGGSSGLSLWLIHKAKGKGGAIALS